MSYINSRTRGKRAGSVGPYGSAKRTNITATDFVNKEGDVRQNLRAFRGTVWRYYKQHGRHDLPWRQTTDPYRILVSEVMLQQTQVPRVMEKYRSFLKKFPTVRALAKAPLSEVLKEWSGLGYNRRGKYLHDAAKHIHTIYRMNIEEALKRSLPGIGPYTRAAVKVFAFNEPDILIETNIRTAFIHHFASLPRTGLGRAAGSVILPIGRITEPVRDSDILELAQVAARGQDPREWHWALMDYGAYLKKSGVRNNQRSAHYTKQPKFEGSLRQMRGDVLKQLHAGKQPKGDAFRLKKALEGLERDGLIKREKGKWGVA